jgi:hypothetical protein
MIKKLIKILFTLGTIIPLLLVLARKMHRSLNGNRMIFICWPKTQKWRMNERKYKLTRE